MNIRLTQDQLRQIDDAIAAGSKIEAVRLCSKFSGAGLRESKEFVESRPAAAMLPPSTTVSGAAVLAALLLVILIALVAYYFLSKPQPSPSSPAAPSTAPTVSPAAAPASIARPANQRPEIVLAASQQDVQKVRDLLAVGADVNTIAPGTQESPLIAALSRPNDRGLELAMLLIEQGADVNHQRQGGDSPLLRAVRNRSAKSVRLLLDHGADPNLRAPRGKSPLSWAIQINNKEIETMLRAAGGVEYDPAEAIDPER